jgi:formate hydrogenlyase subunit 3/multisubunit Na+/H+ antiporter MnhD subunit
VNGSVLVVELALGVVAAAAGGLCPDGMRLRLAAGLTIAACAVAAAAAAVVLGTGHGVAVHSAGILPLTGASLDLAPPSSVFVATTAVVAIAACVYWPGYARHGLSSRTVSAVIPVFVTSMLVVVEAGDAVTFLVAWELMAASSLVLVLAEQQRQEQTRSAAQWYAVMTSAGAGAIVLAMVLVCAHAGTVSFDAIAAVAARPGDAGRLPGGTRDVVLVLALLGFGSKAGMVPVHVWLPKAHPEAPSPASALMSGAMVNLGIYGLVLVADRLVGGAPSWWWTAVVAFGAVSALYGALQASAASDLKRLLAYSTTDNMGLVLVAVGLSGLLATAHEQAVAILALVAALLLVVNHAAFKGCLFLSVGSIQVATGTRDLDSLGGLARRMPVTALLFGVGALSVAAVPPLNGFVGEWLLFESLLHALEASGAVVGVVVTVAVAALALTGGLSATAFVKAIGIGLLGRPRSTGAATAHEVSRSMQIGAGLLAVACVVLGMAPMLVVPSLERAAASLVGGGRPQVLSGGVDIAVAGMEGVLAPLWIAVGLALLGAGTVAARSVVRQRRPASRAADAWACGRELQTARMQYTATSFAEPLERVFDDVLRPDHDLAVSHTAESRYFIDRVVYHSAVADVVERVLYRPAIEAVRWWGSRARMLQNGSVHRYLSYALVALLVVLVVLA